MRLSIYCIYRGVPAAATKSTALPIDGYVSFLKS